MIKIGNTILGQGPRIALVVSDQESNKALRVLAVDALEVRVDKFKNFDTDYIKKNITGRKKTGIPLILTVRNMKSEGGETPASEGQAPISDEEKLKIFGAVISDIDAVDIERKSPALSSVVRLARENKKAVIVSSHDFEDTFKESVLENILKESKEKGADIVKIAAQANSVDDVNRLMEFTLKHKNDNIITISLGDIGSISRLTFPGAGSLLTYSFLGRPAAPGQVPFKILQENLRRYSSEYNGHLIEKFGSLGQK